MNLLWTVLVVLILIVLSLPFELKDIDEDE